MATTHVFTLSDVYRQSLEGTWVLQGWNAAWFGGGYAPTSIRSSVDRINFVSDTTTAVAKGPLSLARAGLSASGSTTDAWFGSGAAPSFASFVSTVDKVIFSSDSATAVAKGPLSLARFLLAAHGNTTDAWFGSGRVVEGSAFVTKVDRIIFASDSATAVAKGPLTLGRYGLGAHGNTTDAWYGGGHAGPNFTTVDRVIFSSDTATAVVKGPLTAGGYGVTAHGSTTDAWFGGGVNPGVVSRVDRIIFASDTATAVAKGPLSAARYLLGAGGNETDAWFGGGRTSPSIFSTVDRVIFSSDTATAVAKGPLSLTKSGLAAD